MNADTTSSNSDDIRAKIYDLVGPYNKKDIDLTPDTTFSMDLDLDSLTVMDLVAVIEDDFDIIIPLNILPDLENIQQVADAVEKIMSEK